MHLIKCNRFKAIYGFIILVIILQGCRIDPPPSNRNNNQSGDTVAAVAPLHQEFPKVNFNFFLETSKSTDAYLAPNKSRFKTAVNALAASLNTHEGRQSFNIWEVSNIPYAVHVPASDEAAKTYFSDLSPRAIDQHIAKANGANRSTSDLSGIISTILDKTGPDDISVLITDCVVDTKTNGSELATQQSALQTKAARRRENGPFAILFIRDTSEFQNGTYYLPDGGIDELTGYRPYFIIIMGNARAVQMLGEELAAKDAQFRQAALLGSPAATPTARLLQSNLEHYEVNGRPANLVAIKAKRAGPKDNFMLRVEADLSNVPSPESYKNNPDNYEATGGPYSIAVQSGALEPYTHTFTLSSTTLGPAHSVHLRLRNSLPEWVEKMSSQNSGHIEGKPEEQHKTYGLYNIVKGLADGLNPGNYIFELRPIQVNR